ncbi:MAG: aldo/keto reductase [Clostridia bacterium]|nr:aldo/keto reductase [Clostridia bacterium]
MRTHLLGGRAVSVIGLGTSEFGGTCPEALGREFMDEYVALGGNLIDTARVYGDFVTPRNGESEKIVGRWMEERHNRANIFLSTKGAHPPLNAMTQGRLSRDDIRGDMAASLEALRTDHVDIYWLHRDDESRPVSDIMETMQGLIEDGYTKLIGVSNWRPRRILEANRFARVHALTPFCANQPQFSLARQMNVEDPTLTPMDAETWQMQLDTQLACFCFSSQAKGFFSKLDALGEAGLPDKARRRFLSDENRAVYARVKQVQQETNLSVGAIALAYLTCQPFPTFALAGATRVEQVRALKEAGDAVITPAQREALRAWL